MPLFSWFQPRCPLNPSEKTWIEFRMAWLLDRLGFDSIRKTEPVLPTGEFFPLPYQGESEQVRAILEKVCQYLHVDPKQYRVNVFGPHRESEPLPPVHQDHIWEVWPERIIYEGQSAEGSQVITIHVTESLAYDLESVIAVFSREICRSLLLKIHDLPPRTYEFEQTVEVMPLFFGLGIFSANVTLRETSLNALGWHSWEIMRQGVFPSRYIGYALALLCWLRNEPLPAWRRYLRRDAEDTLKASLRYLEKTGDTILDQDSAAKPYEQRPLQNWVNDLSEGTPSRRVAALWAIQTHAVTTFPLEYVPRVAENLSHRDPIVRSTAAGALDALGETASRAVPELISALEDRQGSVRMRAALALGKVTSRAEEIILALLPILNDRNIHVANAAAWSLGQFGHQAEEAGSAIVRLLRRGILHCQEETLMDILDALIAVSKHPEEIIQECLLEKDAETCQRALNLLKERQIDATTSKP